MYQFCLSAVVAGLRTRSFLALIVLGFLGMAVVLTTGLFSSRQPDSFTLDVGLSIARMIGLLMSLFWVQELISKEIDRKTVLFALAYPVSRKQYLFGRFLGIAILLAGALLVLSLQMSIAVWLAKIDYEQARAVNYGWPLFWTIIYFWIEMLLVAAVATMLAAISTTPFLPFALGGCFAIIAHSIGPILEYVRLEQLRNPREFVGLAPILDKIRWILPDTSRLDLRVNALYNVPLDVELMTQSLIMACAYGALVLGLGAYSFGRREFT